MALWTVFKVRSLINGGAGQGLEKLGTVEAPHWAGAMAEAHDTWPTEADPRLPLGGLTVVMASRNIPTQ